MPGSRCWLTPGDPRVPPNSRPVREPLPQPRIQPQLAGPQTFRRSADCTPTSLPVSWTPGDPLSVGHLVGSSTLPHSARSWSLRGPSSWVAPVPAAARLKTLEGALDHVTAAQPPTRAGPPPHPPAQPGLVQAATHLMEPLLQVAGNQSPEHPAETPPGASPTGLRPC